MSATDVERKPGRHGPGMTLLEMLIVLALMVLMLTVALTASVEWGRHKALRGALHNLKAGTGLARQYAVTLGNRVYFRYGNTGTAVEVRGFFAITNATAGLLDNTHFLPRGIVFTGAESGTVCFLADGTCDEDSGPWLDGAHDMVLGEDARKDAGLVSTVRVWALTGRAEVLE